MLTAVADRTAALRPGAVPVFACVRNETARLPHFLAHHRRLGAGPFLFVVNDSDDGTAEMLAGEPDCSVWTTQAGYKAARFGMDWVGWLLARHGSGRWCLTLDADELFVYPHWERLTLPDLSAWLEARGRRSFSTLSVDLYPMGRLSQGPAGGDPLEGLTHFDPGPYRRRPQPALGVDLFQGGVRDRLFFARAPDRAPTMNKVPLVRWHWRYAYRNSTHSALPPRLNAGLDPRPGGPLSGALLHTKFMAGVVARSAEEKRRGQHFVRAEVHAAYYDALIADPVLHDPAVSRRYTGWRDLVAAGLLPEDA